MSYLAANPKDRFSSVVAPLHRLLNMMQSYLFNEPNEAQTSQLLPGNLKLIESSNYPVKMIDATMKT